MPTIIDQLLHSPRLPAYLAQMNAVLSEEQQRREQFYEQMTEQEKVEFINGATVVHSPVKLEHAEASENLLMLIKAYVNVHDLGSVFHEKILITLTRNDYEPDICYFRAEVAAQFAPDQMRFPAPDLIVEVLSPSTEERDRGMKFEDYAAHGVAEYWLIAPASRTVEQYTLADERLYPADQGTLGHAQLKRRARLRDPDRGDLRPRPAHVRPARHCCRAP